MQSELKWADISRHLPADADVDAAGDMWPRIAAAYAVRKQRRRRRFASLLGVAAVLIVAAGVAIDRHGTGASAVDWQARAQALELQLNQWQTSANNDRIETEVDLARVDHALQAAYDRGAGSGELADLWKQRSELLRVLLAVRQQRVAMTRI